MRQRKRFFTIGMIVICVLLLFGFAFVNASKKEKIVLEFAMFAGSNWDVENASSYIIIDEAIKRFEENHEGVKVQYTSGILKDDYSEWFAQRLLKGGMPDVFMILADDFNEFASIGILKDLRMLMDKDEAFYDEKYYSAAMESGIYHEKQFALPYEIVPTMMFVNKTLLEKENIDVPDHDWTWDDLYRICRRVTKDLDGDSLLDQFGIYNYNWIDAAHCNDAYLFDSEGTKGYFADSKVIEAVEFTQKLNDLNLGQKVTQEDFDNGKVAFMPLSFSEYRTYKSYPYKIKKYTNFQWDCITMPAGQKGANSSEVNTLLMGISNDTNLEELAWEFLKLLTYDEEIQMKIFSDSQGVSVLKAVTNSDEAVTILMRDMEESEKVIEANVLDQIIENGITTPKFRKYKEALSLAESEVSKIIDSDKNVESSMKILQRTIAKFLN